MGTGSPRIGRPQKCLGSHAYPPSPDHSFAAPAGAAHWRTTAGVILAWSLEQLGSLSAFDVAEAKQHAAALILVERN